MPESLKQKNTQLFVTEQRKADNQMEWIGRMNNIRNRAFEVVLADFIQG